MKLSAVLVLATVATAAAAFGDHEEEKKAEREWINCVSDRYRSSKTDDEVDDACRRYLHKALQLCETVRPGPDRRDACSFGCAWTAVQMNNYYRPKQKLKPASTEDWRPFPTGVGTSGTYDAGTARHDGTLVKVWVRTVYDAERQVNGAPLWSAGEVEFDCRTPQARVLRSFTKDQQGHTRSVLNPSAGTWGPTPPGTGFEVVRQGVCQVPPKPQ